MTVSSKSPRLSRLAEQGSLLVLASFLFFVDLFLPWSGPCSTRVITPFSGRQVFPPALHHIMSVICSLQVNGWGGAGTVAGVLAGLLVLWEGTRVARLDLRISRAYSSLISAGLAFGILVFTVIQIAAMLTWMSPDFGSLLYGGTFAWIALALAVVIALIGLVHWGIWDELGPPVPARPAAPPPTGAVTIPPAVPDPAPPWPQVCAACGRVNPEDAQFCSACGQSLAAPSPRRRSPRRTPPAS